jgi:hypothetical protein
VTESCPRRRPGPHPPGPPPASMSVTAMSCCMHPAELIRCLQSPVTADVPHALKKPLDLLQPLVPLQKDLQPSTVRQSSHSPRQQPPPTSHTTPSRTSPTARPSSQQPARHGAPRPPANRPARRQTAAAPAPRRSGQGEESIEQGEESIPHIISNSREESIQQIVSGIHDPHDILQNLSEQDLCFDSKDLIHRERNAADLYDQRDSKGQRSFIGFKEGIPKDFSDGKEHLKSATCKVSSISVAQCNKVWNIGNRTFGLTLVQPHVLFQQFSNSICMQSSFKMCLHLTNVLWLQCGRRSNVQPTHLL